MKMYKVFDIGKDKRKAKIVRANTPEEAAQKAGYDIMNVYTIMRDLNNKTRLKAN